MSRSSFVFYSKRCVFAVYLLVSLLAIVPAHSHCHSLASNTSLSGPMPNSAIRNCSPAPLDTWASGCVPQTAVVVPVRVVIWWKLAKNRVVFAKFHHRDACKYTHILREQTKNPKLVRYYDSSGCLVTYSDGLFVDRFSQKSPDTLQYGWKETANDQLSVRFDRTKKMPSPNYYAIGFSVRQLLQAVPVVLFSIIIIIDYDISAKTLIRYYPLNTTREHYVILGHMPHVSV